jgi:TatD DNase family protein
VTAAPARTTIVDSHAHLDEPAFDADRGLVVQAARAAGVGRIINIGYSPERWASSCVLRECFPGIDISVGLHPQIADRFDSLLRDALATAIAELRPVALGEMGFDFARDGPDFSQQEQAFRVQLELAMSTRLPVIIHQRAAAEALVVELDRWPDLESIVLHSFDGNQWLMDWAIERGCDIGIGGLATKRASGPLREVLKSAPTSRLLLETDAPYLAPPETKRRRNTPANLPLIAELLAPLWDLTGGELCQVTAANAGRVFGLVRSGDFLKTRPENGEWDLEWNRPDCDDESRKASRISGAHPG